MYLCPVMVFVLGLTEDIGIEGRFRVFDPAERWGPGYHFHTYKWVPREIVNAYPGTELNFYGVRFAGSFTDKFEPAGLYIDLRELIGGIKVPETLKKDFLAMWGERIGSTYCCFNRGDILEFTKAPEQWKGLKYVPDIPLCSDLAKRFPLDPKFRPMPAKDIPLEDLIKEVEF